MKYITLCVLLACAAFVIGSARAHNTNTAHTRITESALAVVEADAKTHGADPKSDAYAELSRDGRIFWGYDPKYNQQQALDAGVSEFKSNQTSVMSGVALEDAPFTRVLTHFYNAYTGDGSPLNILFGDEHDSQVVAHRYFDQAIEVFGYEETSAEATSSFIIRETGQIIEFDFEAPPAKSWGLFLFGHSLHHAEDMSSIAHAHNDAHLTAGDGTLGTGFNEIVDILGSGELDDYESAYLPTLLWDINRNIILYNTLGQETDAFFPKYLNCGTTCTNNELNILRPKTVTQFTDIWAAPSATLQAPGGELINDFAGLGRSVVNLTIFQGALNVPTNPLRFGCMEKRSDTDVAQATGELADMFSTPGFATCAITYDFSMVANELSWNINDIELQIDGVTTIAPGPGKFLSITIPIWFKREPWFLGLIGLLTREESWWPLSVKDGPTAPDGSEYFYIEQIMEGIGKGFAFEPALMVRPARIRANINQLYDPVSNPTIENTPVASAFGPVQPRSLLEIFAEKLVPLAVQYSAGYTKFWYDIANLPPYLQSVRVDQDEETRYEAEWIDLSDVRSMFILNEIAGADEERSFNYVRERTLAIKTLEHIDPSSAFTIIIKFNEPIQLDGVQGLVLTLGGTQLDLANIKATPAPTGDRWYENREWELTVDNFAALFPGGVPEGEVGFTVQAYDRNWHRDSEGGAADFGGALDQNPGSPARRQRINPDQPRKEAVLDKATWGNGAWGFYQWHDESSFDVEYPDVLPGGFEYQTSGPGDRNHVLLFDDTPPEASFEVQ